MNENLKKSLFDLLQFAIVAIIGILGFYFVDNYISEYFPRHTNRMGTYPTLPLYSLAFLQIFFLGMIVFYLWKIFQEIAKNKKFLKIMNYFYFGNLVLIIILIHLIYAMEFANWRPFSILQIVWDGKIFGFSALEYYWYFLIYTLPVYFFVMIIYFLVARLVYRK